MATHLLQNIDDCEDGRRTSNHGVEDDRHIPVAFFRQPIEVLDRMVAGDTVHPDVMDGGCG